MMKHNYPAIALLVSILVPGMAFAVNQEIRTTSAAAPVVVAVQQGAPSVAITGKGTFEAGNKTFLLNGKPFIVKAAEIHYPRIPKEYWDNRMKLCKALGMNTICMYVFWNYHEQKEGVYDFTGQKDIAAFCRLAQQNGLYVIVRPGPYVCAEWEMGGLPWWLLKKKDIQLRTEDPYFMERTGLFMKEVGKQLADLQITRGGNILMVQVENEYGSYGIDKPYVSKIRDMVKASGFTDIPLFQCDWSSNFKNNALDDLLWTVNFGTGANIEAQFAELSALRPNTPLMCSEFWSGWFDNWGRKHETRDAKAMVDGIRDMLDRNISFSLYMTHGGTTFGHWGGANSPGFSPMCSSYDYDAPIGEWGNVTPKYLELRQLLAGYMPKGDTLQPIPASNPIISIPSFNLTEVSPLFENLSGVVKSDTIQTMEDLNEPWGSVLYRTTLPATGESKLLKIEDVHDWAQVFVNGKLLAKLDRRKGENSVAIPPLKKGARLDILVEAMGRINFGKAIKDYKGITNKVELISKGKTTVLKNWQIYTFPSDYNYVSQRVFRNSGGKITPAAYYRGHFTLDKPGDTFLDMSTWGKGLLWVNGYEIGRFWRIGPQQTLYMPGCWLKKGENEVIVLDLDTPEKTVMAGLDKPILDKLSIPEPATHRKGGQNLDLTNEKPVIAGTFAPGNGWQTIKFDKPLTARYLCLEALSSYGNDKVAAIAELEVLGADGSKISREPWKALYADSEETADANNTADKVFDLQESTYWHTAYTLTKPDFPHQIVIDLGKEQTITGVMYLPRPEAGKPGMIKDYRLFVKTSPFSL
ncbi:MAG: beta-galactosidase [Bacteroidota bacterium]|nr:beta-galactosidase [Bacteroidota bacterium]